MKKTIGKKSSISIVINVIGLILLSIMLMLLLGGNDSLQIGDNLNLYIIVILILLVFIIFRIIFDLKKPSKMIQCDDNYLYFNYRNRTEKIELKSILQATPRRTRARNITYSFGKVVLHTKTGNYEIGKVSNCEEVCLQIMEIVREKTEEKF